MTTLQILADSCHVSPEHSLLDQIVTFSHGSYKSIDELTLLIGYQGKLSCKTSSYFLTLKDQKNEDVETLGDRRYWARGGDTPLFQRMCSAYCMQEIRGSRNSLHTWYIQYMKKNLGSDASQAQLGVGSMGVHMAKNSLWLIKVTVFNTLKNVLKNMAEPNCTKPATNFLKRIHLTKSISQMQPVPSWFKFSLLPLSPQNAWVGFQFLVQTVGVGHDVGEKRNHQLRNSEQGFRDLGP